MNKKLFQTIVLMLAATLVAGAEMQTWTFEKSGKTMQGEVVGFERNSVLLKVPEGKTLSVAIAYLVKSNRIDLAAERILFDPVETAAARAECVSGSRMIKGKILQKLPNGLLVSSGEETLADVGVTHYSYTPGLYGGLNTSTTESKREGDKPGDLCLGLVLLADFPNYSKVVDGDTIEVLGHRVGDYSYTTTQNATRTVREFSASLDAAAHRRIAQKIARKQFNAVENQWPRDNHEGPSRTIAGKVLQKLPNGLLVDSGAYEMTYDDGEHVYHGKASFILNTPREFEQTTRHGRPVDLYVGLVLLVDCSKYSDVVDDDLISVMAYPVGEYSYTTAQGSQKTVRKFSAKPR